MATLPVTQAQKQSTWSCHACMYGLKPRERKGLDVSVIDLIRPHLSPGHLPPMRATPRQPSHI